MKLRYKFSAYVFLAGVLCVALLTAFYTAENRRNSLVAAGESSHAIAENAAHALDVLLSEKSLKALALTHNEGIVTALMESNDRFSLLSDESRAATIDSLNNRWISTDDPGDAFIENYTHNTLATFLRTHMASMGDEYGEIFLTDRYGVLVASTGRLTTLKHAHKYWWQAAHYDGAGRIFFDDRGFDTSVGDYVIGVVVPVWHAGEIIGILKSNINIIGIIGSTLRRLGHIYGGKLLLIRSCGLIVYQEGIEPLTSELDSTLISHIGRDSDMDQDHWFETPNSIFSYSTIQISEGSMEFGFGGSYESIDHILGNEGETWLILAEIDRSVALQTAGSTAHTLLYMGMITVLILAGVAFLFGNRMAKPIIRIAEHTNSVRAGSLEIRCGKQSNDEIGELATSIDSMTERLQQYSTEMEELVSQRTRELEKALDEVKTLHEIIPICSFCKQIRNDKGAWEQLESYFMTHTDSMFTHGICPECQKKLMDNGDL